jgi:hypothetical protein
MNAKILERPAHTRERHKRDAQERHKRDAQERCTGEMHKRENPLVWKHGG